MSDYEPDMIDQMNEDVLRIHLRAALIRDQVQTLEHQQEVTRLNAVLDNIKKLAPKQFAECERLRGDSDE